MKFVCILICSLTFALSVSSEPITVTTINGETYTDVSLSRVEPDGLIIMTETGVEKLHFEILPDEVQRKYGYDPGAASKYERAVREAAQRRQVEQTIQRQQRAVSKELENSAVQLRGTVLSVTRKGVLLKDADVAVEEVVDVVVNRNLLNDNPWYQKRIQQRRVSVSEPVFVYGVTGLVDGKWFDERVYRAPIYTYRALNGAQKTVSGYAISKELAQHLFSQAKEQ